MVLCLLTGVTLVTAGHVGAVSGAWAPEVRAALDGGLAPLRNLHKFDVVLRLPLVLAGAFLLERLLAVPRLRRDLVPQARRGVVLLTATTALVGVSLPVTGRSGASANSKPRIASSPTTRTQTAIKASSPPSEASTRRSGWAMIRAPARLNTMAPK